jgi:uncharacterized protein YodC (DUF2158 family)
MIQPSDTVIAKDGTRRMIVIGLNHEEDGGLTLWCEWTDSDGRTQADRFPESEVIKLQS